MCPSVKAGRKPPKHFVSPPSPCRLRDMNRESQKAPFKRSIFQPAPGSTRSPALPDPPKLSKTHSINSAFLDLRHLIPTDPVDRKLSKIETLQLASSYISHLRLTLQKTSIPYSDNLVFPTQERCPDSCTFCVQARKKKCSI